MRGIPDRDKPPAPPEDEATTYPEVLEGEEEDQFSAYASAAAGAALVLAQLVVEEEDAMKWTNPLGVRGALRAEVYEAIFAWSCCNPKAILTGPTLLAELHPPHPQSAD